jgi:hypothetical protein
MQSFRRDATTRSHATRDSDPEEGAYARKRAADNRRDGRVQVEHSEWNRDSEANAATNKRTSPVSGRKPTDGLQ